jgi:succinoglycan biosynthesis transport protein ExoP
VAVFAATAGTPTAAPALALARALAGDAKVVLVGLVAATAREALGLEPNAAGVADVVSGAASFGQVIRRDKGSRVHLVAFGRSDVGIDAIVTSRRFLTMIEALAKAYDHVVVDAGDLGSGAFRLAANVPRGVLIASPDAQRDAASASRMLSGAGFTDIAVMTPATAASGQPHDLAAA